MTKRALKIGFGIAFLIVGLFATIGGVALTSLVGADGRFELPETTARSRGYALVFDAIYIRGNLPASGSLSATLGIEVRGQEGRDVFVGVAPSSRVSRYLAGAGYDRVVRVAWPGGAGTEAVLGNGSTPGPPGEQTWWESSDEGDTASVSWTVRDGDWAVVVMNADGSRDVDVAGTVEVELPILGPIALGMLITGLVILLIGALMTVSGARSPRVGPGVVPASPGTGAIPSMPPATPAAGSGPPPRPDA